MDVFSESDIEVFDEVLAEFGESSFEELMHETHKHPAYKRAWRRRGNAKRALMDYADMVEDEDKRVKLVEDIEPIAHNVR